MSHEFQNNAVQLVYKGKDELTGIGAALRHKNPKAVLERS
jgi:hypothetical protein